jgi:hypothetical protein
MVISRLSGELLSDHDCVLRRANTLRHIWDALSGDKYSQEEIRTLDLLQTRAIQCCVRIWVCVRHVLCDDSPEGHLPEELEEVDGLDTKDLLSYSFRAIHESRFAMA